PIVAEAVKILAIKDVYQKNKIKRNYEAFIDGVGQPDSEKLYEKLSNGSGIDEECAEVIFDTIVTSIKPLKAKILGQLIVGLANGKLNVSEYKTLAYIIHSCSIPALLALEKYYQNNNSSVKNMSARLENEGLLISLGVATRQVNKFRIDELGEKLAKYGMKSEYNKKINKD
ncbi:hypothetical protein, partial [Shewanella sp. GutDb-MelDb]|uniref:hypothetical protein n=1 Tax=Shewanella sp. GutDb-MelDb TaxID=2058316 RepID=UPI000CC3E783